MPRKRIRTVAMVQPSWLERYGFNITTLATVIFFGLGFYFSTTYTLTQHSDSLRKLELSDRTNEKAREKVREEFVTNAERTAKGISDLNTKTEVQNVQLQSIKEALDKINRTLENASITRK